MRHYHPLVLLALVLAVAPLTSVLRAQPCEPAWTPGLFEALGTDGRVRAMEVFEDAGGPALYVAGNFDNVGALRVNKIARWDGRSWSALGAGVDGRVTALAVFDDGSGPALYVAGMFRAASGVHANYIARWDGKHWSALGIGMSGGNGETWVRALTVFDDGSGPALYAGGRFAGAGAVPADLLAKWNGKRWSALGETSFAGFFPEVRASEVFDEGTGAALYVGGSFQSVNAVEVNYVARWDGATWSPLASGMQFREHHYVAALLGTNDGPGPVLYAGGWFWSTAAGVVAPGIAAWDGKEWRSVGGSMEEMGVFALTRFDDGHGPAVYAGGSFKTAGGVPANAIAKWDGRTWSALGDGLRTGAVETITGFNDDAGPALYAGGSFLSAGGFASANIARWGLPLPRGDLNSDGDVDLSDLGILLSDFGCATGACPGDADCDGDTDLSDLAIVLANFGR